MLGHVLSVVSAAKLNSKEVIYRQNKALGGAGKWPILGEARAEEAAADDAEDEADTEAETEADEAEEEPEEEEVQEDDDSSEDEKNAVQAGTASTSLSVWGMVRGLWNWIRDDLSESLLGEEENSSSSSAVGKCYNADKNKY